MRVQSKVNLFFCAIGAIAITVLFYLIVHQLKNNKFYEIMTQRGPIQYITTFATFWALCILAWKLYLLLEERKAIHMLDLLPKEGVIDQRRAREILLNIHGMGEQERNRFITRRVERAVERMAKTGSTTEVDDALRDQAAIDENIITASYIPVRALIWGIPLLGFLGTVIGMSAAIGKFAQIVMTVGSVEAMKGPLSGATKDLALAFDTTLVALVASLIVMFFMSRLQQEEEAFLTELDEYCLSNILARLRATEVASVSMSEGELKATLEQLVQLLQESEKLEELQLILAANLQAVAAANELRNAVAGIGQVLGQIAIALEKLSRPRRLTLIEDRGGGDEE
ncbi:MAG: MotA/TolQ/ExbB proton channel family protein, partial [Halobacteria archaeon]